MSVAQVLEEVKSFSVEEIEELEASLRAEKRRRTRQSPHVLSAEETRLFSIINEALPGGEELQKLRAKREDESLAPNELEQLIKLENEREIVWARKLKAVSALADLRGQDFEALYQQLGLALRSES